MEVSTHEANAMNNPDTTPAAPRNLWLRAAQTFVLLVALYVAMWLLVIVSVVQVFATAVNDHPNDDLRRFAQSLGAYMAEVASFGSFTRDDPPFPFGDWPPAV
jgi:hypothetical protein